MSLSESQKKAARSVRWRCPWCSATAVTADPFTGTATKHTSHRHCRSCGRMWVEVWTVRVVSNGKKRRERIRGMIGQVGK